MSLCDDISHAGSQHLPNVDAGGSEIVVSRWVLPLLDEDADARRLAACYHIGLFYFHEVAWSHFDSFLLLPGAWGLLFTK